MFGRHWIKTYRVFDSYKNVKISNFLFVCSFFFIHNLLHPSDISDFINDKPGISFPNGQKLCLFTVFVWKLVFFILDSFLCLNIVGIFQVWVPFDSIKQSINYIHHFDVIFLSSTDSIFSMTLMMIPSSTYNSDPILVPLSPRTVITR